MQTYKCVTLQNEF